MINTWTPVAKAAMSLCLDKADGEFWRITTAKDRDGRRFTDAEFAALSAELAARSPPVKFTEASRRKLVPTKAEYARLRDLERQLQEVFRRRFRDRTFDFSGFVPGELRRHPVPDDWREVQFALDLYRGTICWNGITIGLLQVRDAARAPQNVDELKGYTEHDVPVFKNMRTRLESGEFTTVNAAATDLVGNATGKGELASKIKRLAANYPKWRRLQVKE